MAATRIYVVTENGLNPRLVRATYRATAIRHAAATRFKARIATQADLEKLIVSGVRVEVAADDAAAEAAEPAQA